MTTRCRYWLDVAALVLTFTITAAIGAQIGALL